MLRFLPESGMPQIEKHTDATVGQRLLGAAAPVKTQTHKYLPNTTVSHHATHTNDWDGDAAVAALLTQTASITRTMNQPMSRYIPKRFKSVSYIHFT